MCRFEVVKHFVEGVPGGTGPVFVRLGLRDLRANDPVLITAEGEGNTLEDAVFGAVSTALSLMPSQPLGSKGVVTIPWKPDGCYFVPDTANHLLRCIEQMIATW